jgi:hypothetical protein
MTERIKELWYQCKSIDWSIDNPNYDHEKFAELIVLECAAIANRAENDEYWIAPVGDLIVQHFGIKE